MKSILTALLIALSVSSAHAASPAYYSCEGSDLSTQFTVYNDGNDVIVADGSEENGYRAKYIKIYGGTGDEIYEKVFSTSQVDKKIIDSSIHAIGITQSMMEGIAETATLRLLTYNNPSKKDLVVKSINVRCKLIEAR